MYSEDAGGRSHRQRNCWLIAPRRRWVRRSHERWASLRPPLQRSCFFNSSGNFAIFAAIRLASSRVSNFAAERRPGSLQLLQVCVTHNGTVGRDFGAPGRREAAAGVAKFQLFCRTLRQTVRGRREPSPNRKSTSGNNFARLGILCAQISAGCVATCENQQSDGSIRHPIRSRRQAPRQ